jgi:hypothetical protein
MAKASEHARCTGKNRRSEETLLSSLEGAGRLRMTSVLWALADIDFQTFDRRIDRSRPSPARHTHTHTHTINSLALLVHVLLPNLCRNASKKTLLHVERTIISRRRLSRYCREDSSSTSEDRHVLSLA